eukprot:2836179-Prorocentrum_lima.AAC.1
MTTPTYVTDVTDLPEVEKLFNEIDTAVTDPPPYDPRNDITTQHVKNILPNMLRDLPHQKPGTRPLQQRIL